MIIYKITNLVNNRVYIGQTVCLISKRWKEHRCSTKNTPLYSAMRKHGTDNFKIEVICTAIKPEHLNELEQYFIKLYDCLVPNGYNLTTGGDSTFSRSEHTKNLQSLAAQGHKVSQETRDKISKSLMGRPGARRGTKHTDEARQKISAVQIGRKASEETKKKMSETHKKRLALNSERTLAQLEVLKRLKEQNTGRVPWNKGLKLKKS